MFNPSLLQPNKIQHQYRNLGYKDIILQNQRVSFCMNTGNDHSLNYLKVKLKLLGVDNELCETLDPLQVDKWDIKLLHTLNMLELPFEAGRYYINLLNATVKGEYEKFLFDTGTSIGIRNTNIRSQFQKNGLNFDNWMNFNRDSKKTFDFTVENKTYEIALWERNPGKDFFIGNYTGSCISTFGDNSYRIYNGLVGVTNQYILIREKGSQELAGYCRIAVNVQQRELIKEFIHLQYLSPLEKNSTFQNALNNFVNQYNDAVINTTV